MTDIGRLIDAVEAGIVTLSQIQDLCIPIWPNGEDHWKHIAVSFAYDREDLNAAKRLHDALLPDVRCSIIIHESNKSRVSIWRCLPRRWWQIVGPIEDLANETSESPARAWLLAILKAYRSTL